MTAIYTMNSRKERSIAPRLAHARAPFFSIKFLIHQFKTPDPVITTKTASPRPFAVLILEEHAR